MQIFLRKILRLLITKHSLFDNHRSRIQPSMLWAVVTIDRNCVIDHSQIWQYASSALRNVEYLVKQDENYHLCHLGEELCHNVGGCTLSNILPNISGWKQQAGELQHFCLWNTMQEAEGCGFVHTSFQVSKWSTDVRSKVVLGTSSEREVVKILGGINCFLQAPPSRSTTEDHRELHCSPPHWLQWGSRVAETLPEGKILVVVWGLS